MTGFIFQITRSLFGGKQPQHALSHKEQMFSSILEKAVGGKYKVYSKIPMSDVFEATPELSDRAKRKALKPIEANAFDYIVCDSISDAIVCAVELDDHSFDKKQFKKQDLFLEELCHAVSLPLLRVAPQNGYNLVEIIERFERTITPIDYDRHKGENKYRLKLVEFYRSSPERDESCAA